MTNLERRKLAYKLFGSFGIAILLLALLGAETGLYELQFFLIMFPMLLGFVGWGIMAGLLALFLFAATLGLRCKEDPVLVVIGALAIPFAIWSVDIILFTNEGVSVETSTRIFVVFTYVYSLACILFAIRFALQQKDTRPKG